MVRPFVDADILLRVTQAAMRHGAGEHGCVSLYAIRTSTCHWFSGGNARIGIHGHQARPRWLSGPGLDPKRIPSEPNTAGHSSQGRYVGIYLAHLHVEQAFQSHVLRRSYKECSANDLEHGTEVLKLAMDYGKTRAKLVPCQPNVWKVNLCLLGPFRRN
eukprot:TRINITY_DN4348_c0_g1_i1.p1 TRINITY_DN4348_c0_g1~~TRINITY_DN4348_c0_g1_i1.p1  ORF type:complete len:159 (-),score=13.11 TRINITY_DN4348_c0_g1_i1:402-878(-)